MSLLRVQAGGSDDSQACLVLLHGFGSDEQDLLSLGAELQLDIPLFCFRAPGSTGFGGYAWYNIEFLPDGSRSYDKRQSQNSRDLVITELLELRERFETIILGGFSQGAITSLGVAIARPDLVQGLLLWSGALNDEFLPNSPSHILAPGEAPSEHLPPSFVELPKLVQHGTQDPVLSIYEGRKIAKFLEDQGAAGTYSEYPMAHQMSFESLKESRLWLSDLLASHNRV